jgi:hypothetical protein
MHWTLKAYAEYCIREDWTNETKGDREWAEVLALAIDKFARGWVASNCAGRAREWDRGEHSGCGINTQQAMEIQRLRAALKEARYWVLLGSKALTAINEALANEQEGK